MTITQEQLEKAYEKFVGGDATLERLFMETFELTQDQMNELTSPKSAFKQFPTVDELEEFFNELESHQGDMSRPKDSEYTGVYWQPDCKIDWAHSGSKNDFNYGIFEFRHKELQGGGEGDGEEYWFVFSVSSTKTGKVKYFKWDGYHASYDGGYLNDLFEVVPEEHIAIRWNKK